MLADLTFYTTAMKGGEGYIFTENDEKLQFRQV